MTTRADIEAGFRVDLSNKVSEADAVTRLVHDGFVEAGFSTPRVSGRRVIGPYLNPGVVFAICRSGENDVASGVGIPDGPFGLPSDRAFPDLVGDLRSHGRPVFEGGSLVVAPRWRRHRRRVLVLLLATFLRTVAQQEEGTLMVVSMHPRHTRFYQALLGVTLLNDSPRDLFGEPADLGVSDWSTMINHLRDSDGQLQRDLLEAAVEPDPHWFRDDVSPDPLPASWFAPLAAEDPEIERVYAQVRLLGGERVVVEA